jgi:hypothetical protein
MKFVVLNLKKKNKFKNFNNYFILFKILNLLK